MVTSGYSMAFRMKSPFIPPTLLPLPPYHQRKMAKWLFSVKWLSILPIPYYSGIMFYFTEVFFCETLTIIETNIDSLKTFRTCCKLKDARYRRNILICIIFHHPSHTNVNTRCIIFVHPYNMQPISIHKWECHLDICPLWILEIGMY